MKERLNFWLRRRVKHAEASAPSEAPKKIEPSVAKSFVFVFQPESGKTLDLQAYREGREDEAIQKWTLFHTFKMTHTAYDSLEKLMEDKSKPGNHTQGDNTCGVLFLNCSPDEAYTLMKNGTLSQAIVDAKFFEEVSWKNQKSSGQRIKPIRL